MPIYEYECPEGTLTEKVARMDTDHIKCPKCGQRAKRIISKSSFKLKGGGWFADGYSSNKHKSK